MPTLFKRTFDNDGKMIGITNEVTKGCEWVLKGEGTASRKRDGTCVMFNFNNDGLLTMYRRYDCKRGRTPPKGFIPCDVPDLITGHWPGWVEIEDFRSGDGRIFEACFVGYVNITGFIPKPGTYEAVGPKINGNPENLDYYTLIKHGAETLNVKRSFEGIKKYLETHYIEGIVFCNGDNMCKIKRVDFGLEWNGKTHKR